MSKLPSLHLGAVRAMDGSARAMLHLPAHHLVTHGVVVGMTGSGKTGLVTVLVEEALRTEVPVIVIDVKGDLPNLLLAFPSFAPEELRPWVTGSLDEDDGEGPTGLAEKLAAERRQGLEAWGVHEDDLAAFRARTDIRVITPGSSAGEPLHILSSLERRSDRWDSDPESARAALGAAVSLVLRLLGRDPDPAKSREHVLLSILAERRLASGEPADLATLLDDVAHPPIETVGALPIDEFLPKAERRTLAAALNTLLASPTFASWRTGATLDVDAWLAPKEGRTQAIVVSVAHLDDDERALVLGVLLEEVLAWVRTLPGSQRLRALLVFDEVYGFLPPHPANPPTKRPIVALMKQARAFGVGVVVATQNPMDLDYRALSNAGLWCVGRLQTDADRARVIDGLAVAGVTGAGASGGAGEGRGRGARGARGAGAGRGEGAGGALGAAELSSVIKRLAPRWFVVRDAHGGLGVEGGVALLSPRWAMSFLRGPMTRGEVVRAREGWGRRSGASGAQAHASSDGAELASASAGRAGRARGERSRMFDEA